MLFLTKQGRKKRKNGNKEKKSDGKIADAEGNAHVRKKHNGK